MYKTCLAVAVRKGKEESMILKDTEKAQQQQMQTLYLLRLIQFRETYLRKELQNYKDKIR